MCWRGGLLLLITTLLAPPVLAERLVLGMVSDSPKKHYARMKQMVDYVAERLTDVGVTEGDVVFAADSAQMIQYLRTGQVDWVTESVFGAIEFEQEAGAEILVRRWKKGVPAYHTVFITRKDSDIQTLDDLRGKVLALEDPGSTTAFYLPRAELHHAGLSTVAVNPLSTTLPAQSVGYVLAGSELNIVTWVHHGRVDAGAISNLDWQSPRRTPLSYRDELRIFHRSRTVPRALELVREGLAEPIKQRMKDILLAAHTDSAAKKALKAYGKTRRFDLLDAESKSELALIRELSKNRSLSHQP